MSGAPADLDAQVKALIESGDTEGAAIAAIRRHGPLVLGYLRSVLHDDARADDAFSLFCEHLWRGIGKYRGESPLRGFIFGVAWGAVRRVAEDGFHKRTRRLQTSEVSRIADEVRSSTMRRGEQREGIERLRLRLEPEEQTLLFLRIDQKLAWREVTEALREAEPDIEEAAVRKRFERVKAKLKKLAEQEGLLGQR